MRNSKADHFFALFKLVSFGIGMAVLFLACVPGVRAQSESINATIRGRITDQSGQPVVGATVSTVNDATGYARSVPTGDDGYYVIPALPIGTYTLTVTKDGFSTLKFPGIDLQAGREAVVDGALKIGSVSTSIEVSGGAPVVDPAQTNIGRTISEQEIQNLPLTSRNPYNWIMFQPGVSGHPNAELGIPRTLNTNGFVDRINYQMDGMVDTESDRYGLRLFPISSVYVSEVQTVSNSFAPEFGGTTGNIYNVITGSGTNNIHGMFQWIRGPVDTTARPILLGPTKPKPNLLMNSYGMNAGGPIKKDKLFIFGAYEHLYRALPVPITVSAANQAALQAIGVPSTQFGTAPSVQHAQFLDVRGDWNINEKNRVFARVNYFRNEYPFNTAVGGLNLLAAESDFRDRAHVGGLQWVTTISPQLLNEFRFSYPYRNEKHIPGSLTGPGPAVTILGVGNFNGTVSAGDVLAEKIPSWNDNVTYIRGPHTFKGGFGYSRIIDVQEAFNGFTQYVFQTIAAYQAAVSGANPKSYNTVNAVIGDTRAAYISNFFNFFAQDSWQFRPSLLVTYGIRYDRFLSPNANAAAPFPFSRDFHNPAGDVSPRLGLAWRLGSKTVVRASWGMFYDAPPTNLWFNALSNDGSGRSFNASLSPGSPGAPSFPQPLTTATAPATPSVFAVTPNFKNAYAMTATLQVSRELSKDDALTFAYVNTAGRQLQWLHNINLINPLGFLLDGRPVFDSRVNAGTRANPAFNNVTLQDVGASSRYNALEINYEHRFSHGLVASAAYIFSHTISDAPDVNGFEQNLVYVEDPTNRLRDRGNSYINRPQSLTASTVWSPRAKVANSIVNRLLNDNEFAVLTNIASGDQQNVTTNANLNQDSLVTSITRPLNIGRNTVRGPKIVQFDVRYTRTLFTLKERIRAQFLTEATNIFNHPNVTSLNTVVGVVTNVIATDPTSPGCPTAKNNFTFDPTHCGQLAAGSLPSSFPRVSTVLQGRILDFGLGVRW
jgi:Carboxypeptidase regulatory-like domain/TonB dependent receptor